MWVLLAVLSVASASSAKCSCSCPSTATGPVSGPSIPIDVAHFVAAAFVPLLFDELLPQPARISAPSAVVATIAYAFIRHASPSQDGWLLRARPQANCAGLHGQPNPPSRQGGPACRVPSSTGQSLPIGGAARGQLAGAPQVATTPS